MEESNSIQWMRQLGIIPVSSPPVLSGNTKLYDDLLSSSRNVYQEFLSRFTVSSLGSETEQDLLINNPLSLDENNIWIKRFEQDEIKKTIRLDIQRIHFDDTFDAKNVEFQHSLENILYIWSKLHPDISYRQGMHELAAIVYYAVQLDSLQFYTNQQSRYIEHDVYTIFFRIMIQAKQSFEIDNSNNVVQSCQRMHYRYLKTVDKELSSHLESLGIEPRLYGIKWLRLLFSREFDLESTVKLWTEVVLKDDLAMVEWVGVSCLYSARTTLLSTRDMSSVLKTIMNLVDLNLDVNIVIKNAHLLREKYQILTNSASRLMDKLSGFEKLSLPELSEASDPKSLVIKILKETKSLKGNVNDSVKDVLQGMERDLEKLITILYPEEK